MLVLEKLVTLTQAAFAQDGAAHQSALCFPAGAMGVPCRLVEDAPYGSTSVTGWWRSIGKCLYSGDVAAAATRAAASARSLTQDNPSQGRTVSEVISEDWAPL